MQAVFISVGEASTEINASALIFPGFAELLQKFPVFLREFRFFKKIRTAFRFFDT